MRQHQRGRQAILANADGEVAGPVVRAVRRWPCRSDARTRRRSCRARTTATCGQVRSSVSCHVAALRKPPGALP